MTHYRKRIDRLTLIDITLIDRLSFEAIGDIYIKSFICAIACYGLLLHFFHLLFL